MTMCSNTRNKTTQETMKVYSMQVAKSGRPSLMSIARTASNGRNRRAVDMMMSMKMGGDTISST